MLRPALFALLFTSTLIATTGFGSCGGTEGEGEGEAGEGEGGEGEAGEGEGEAGEGEGEAGEGEGEAGEGEGEAGEGEGEGEGETSTRSFTCQSSTVVSQTQCDGDIDCAIGFIALDCCGSQQATGVNNFDICGFQAEAGNCFQAECDCLAQPTRADDGTSAATSEANPVVACVDHVCVTTYP